VPSLEETTGTKDSKVFISDVAKRVKCEITDAVADKIALDEYAWMADWTAKIDLTLQVNNAAGVTPGVTYTKYLRNAFNYDAGSSSLTQSVISPVNQFFSMGAGANLGEQAIRAEVISFTLSLRELNHWKYPPPGTHSDYASVCPRPKGTELNDNLGLREWVDSALYPVETSDLQSGVHPSPIQPTRTSLPTLAVVTTYAALPPVAYDAALERLRKADEEAEAALKQANKDAKSIETKFKQVEDAYKQYLTTLAPYLKNDVSKLGIYSKETSKALAEAIALREKVSKSYVYLRDKAPHDPVAEVNLQSQETNAKNVTVWTGYIKKLGAELAQENWTER
jgi:hypothetical protein